MDKTTALIAMSGGVDSAVSAYLTNPNMSVILF